jgi:hypothetical protein
MASWKLGAAVPLPIFPLLMLFGEAEAPLSETWSSVTTAEAAAVVATERAEVEVQPNTELMAAIE